MHSNAEKQKKLEQLADQLSEHFDSVIILCSGNALDGTGATVSFKAQRGNVFAHEGLVRDYIRQQDAYHHGYHSESGRRDYKRLNPPEG